MVSTPGGSSVDVIVVGDGTVVVGDDGGASARHRGRALVAVVEADSLSMLR